MQIRTKVRSKIRHSHIKRRYEAGRNKALDKAGSVVRHDAKRQMRLRSPKKKPTWRRVGEKDGLPVVEMSFRPPTPGKVTSWKTGRGRAARGFLRSSIMYERDDRRGSVAIGPAENTVWLNRIQEFGGQRTVAWRMLTGKATDRVQAGGQWYRMPQKFGGGGIQGRNKKGRFTKARFKVAWIVKRSDAEKGRKTKGGVYATTSGKVKPGRYMGKGLKKAMPKIPQQFRNTISGP